MRADSQKLHDDLLKVEQLETKITSELQTLKDNISRMEDELVVYSDLDQLKMDAEEKKKVRSISAPGIIAVYEKILSDLFCCAETCRRQSDFAPSKRDVQEADAADVDAVSGAQGAAQR